MGFDYIEDLFGKFRKGKITRFSEIEKRTKSLFEKLLKGKITFDEFYVQFSAVLKEFNELRGNVIDENTPLWLNSFGAYVFIKWSQWHQLRVIHRDNPEKFETPESERQYQNIVAMRYDDWLMDKIRACLKEL